MGFLRNQRQNGYYLEILDSEKLGPLTLAVDSVVLSLVAQTVKNLPRMQDTQVQSLGQEDHLEKGMATHASILAWRIPWTEEPSRLQSMWVAKSRTRLSD